MVAPAQAAVSEAGSGGSPVLDAELPGGPEATAEALIEESGPVLDEDGGGAWVVDDAETTADVADKERPIASEPDPDAAEDDWEEERAGGTGAACPQAVESKSAMPAAPSKRRAMANVPSPGVCLCIPVAIGFSFGPSLGEVLAGGAGRLRRSLEPRKGQGFFLRRMHGVTDRHWAPYGI